MRNNDDTIKYGSHMVQKMMLIEEGILISVFFAALLSFIVSDRITKSHVSKKKLLAVLDTDKKTCEDGSKRKDQVTQEHSQYDY